MTVVFLTEFYPATPQADVRGGVEQRTWQISQGLSQHYQVEVIASRERGQPAESQVGQVRVWRPGSETIYGQAGQMWTRWRYLWAARRVVQQRAPDVIVLENFLAYAVGLTLPARLRTKSYLTYHDVWVGQYVRHLGLMLGLVGEIIEWLALRTQWRGILANSQYTASNVRRWLRRKSVPIYVVSNGLSFDQVAAVPAERFSNPTIVTVARLVTYKRIDDLLRALVIVRQSVPNVRLVVIGSGPLAATWKQLGRDLGIDEAVEWRGFVPDHRDVLSAIKGAQVFSLPSAVEGYGFVTLEAMACATPYVSADIPATREVTGGFGGQLYPVGDVKTLAAGLVSTLQRPRSFSLSSSVEQHLHHYRWSDIIAGLRKIIESPAPAIA